MSALDSLPPPIGPRGLAARVAVQGFEAQAAGQPVTACPYGATRPYSRRAWVMGWVRAAEAAGLTVLGHGDPDENTPWPGNGGDPTD